MERNNTSFPMQVTDRLRRAYKALVEDAEHSERDKRIANFSRVLKYYQFLTLAYAMSPPKGTRGLLVYYKMGLGKTYLALSIMLASRQPVIFLSSKSLHENFGKSLKTLLRILYPRDHEKRAKQAEDRLKYVTMNAHNMADQVMQASKFAMGKKEKSAVSSGILDNVLLIVDEAHNFFRAIINSADNTTNDRRLYEMIMNSNGLRVVFLTGTPSSKHPFEMVPCFNMLAGRDLLPTNYDLFVRSFIDTEANRIKNRHKLANRLVGMVSHVGYDLKLDEHASDLRLEFPEELPLKVEEVEMSEEQYRQYLIAREKEASEGKSKGSDGKPAGRAPLGTVKTALSLPGSERSTGSSYYVDSRRIGNYAPPSRFMPTKSVLDTVPVADLPDEAFGQEESPKIHRMMENLRDAPGPVLIYSQFTHSGGLEVVARYLEKEGYARLEAKTDLQPAKRYAVISGDVSPEGRQHVVSVNNRKENMHGELLKVILVSKSGAEGYSFRYGRQVHILEPYWDKSLERQIYARFIRLGSHVDLPPEERNVQPFLYIAGAHRATLEKMPDDLKETPVASGVPIGTTVDESFHIRATATHALNEDMSRVLQDVSIECSLYETTCTCHMCRPTNAVLFHDSVEQDLRLADPCERMEEQNVETQLVALDGVEYRYRADDQASLGYRFYDYDENLKAYVEIDPASPLYMRLLDITAAV